RIIVAQTVEPSSEPGAVPKLLNQAQALVKPCEQEIDQLLLDAGFFCFAVILLALKNDLDLLCPKGGSQNKRRDKPKYFPKSKFEYIEELDLYNCPGDKALYPAGELTTGPETEQFQRYQMRPEICAVCPLKAQCTNSPKGRSIKRYKAEVLKEALCEVMKQAGAKKAYSKRQARVEPVFGELRGQQDLNRFRRVGHGKVKVEFSLHAMSHNLRRCLILVGKVEKERIEGSKEAYFVILVRC
ncbi:MAG: transposase, partial [Planctomycetota bacterium]|nr:transposase [Planctomycetota bacterium]